MCVQWSDLEVFLAAVRSGSYTAAGRQLQINRTTIGRRIEALERALDASLFESTPTGPAPTVAGLRLLQSAELIEREVAAMLADIGGIAQRSSSVRIVSSGGIASEFLGELASFRRDNPDVPIELLGELDPLDAVSQRRADLGIAFARTLPVRLAGIQVATLSQARYGRRDIADLKPLGWGYEFASALPGGPSGGNPAGEAAQAAGLTTLNSWPQLKQAVLAGVGSATLWCFAADDEPDLECLSPPDRRHDSTLWLVHRAKAPPGPGMARLIQFLQHAIAKRCEATDGKI
jgi:DNA-binding transcriptional LysR family regulator